MIDNIVCFLHIIFHPYSQFILCAELHALVDVGRDGYHCFDCAENYNITFLSLLSLYRYSVGLFNWNERNSKHCFPAI